MVNRYRRWLLLDSLFGWMMRRSWRDPVPASLIIRPHPTELTLIPPSVIRSLPYGSANNITLKSSIFPCFISGLQSQVAAGGFWVVQTR